MCPFSQSYCVWIASGEPCCSFRYAIVQQSIQPVPQLPTMDILKILWFALLLHGSFYSSNQFLLVEAVLAGAIVIPHGDFAYDPALLPPGTVERDIARHVAIASRTAGHWMFHDAGTIDPLYWSSSKESDFSKSLLVHQRPMMRRRAATE